VAGHIWVDANTTDAWAARVSPSGETLWEVRIKDGWSFEVEVEMSDGTFLLAMRPKKSNLYHPVTVVSLDANGQLLNDPVTLEAEGFAYEGKDCLLVKRVYDTDSRTPPITLLSVNGKGETLWEHTYNELKGTGFWVYPAANGYIVCGMAQDAPFDQTSSTGMMAKLDDQGNFLWKRLMEQYPNTGISYYLEADDGGMFGSGSNSRRYQDDPEPYEMSDFVVRFDAGGNVMWCRYYPELEPANEDHEGLFIYDLLPAPDDGVLIIAMKRRATDDLHFIHLDRDGSVLADWWQKIADFPTDFVRAVIVGEQTYLVHVDKPGKGPSTNTYVTPFVWPEN
jgi:hypothetical protein